MRLSLPLLILSCLSLSTPLLFAEESTPPPPPEITPLDASPPVVTAPPPPLPPTAGAPAPEAATPPPAPPAPTAQTAPTPPQATPAATPTAVATATPAPAPSAAPTIAAPEPLPSVAPPIAEQPPAPVPSAEPSLSAPIEATAPPVLPEATPAPVEAAAPEVTRTVALPARASDFQLLRPKWAVELSYSPSALGKSDISGGLGVTAKGFALDFQYQPPWLQWVGVISVGPALRDYPFVPLISTPSGTGVTNTAFAVLSVGAQARYQARFFREQLIVPVVALDAERFMYHTNTYGSGAFNLTGPIVGFNLLLNPLEPSQAYEVYANSGVLRSYLTFEVASLKGSDQNLTISGASYYFGLRVEF